jgi:hypothetical protein
MYVRKKGRGKQKKKRRASIQQMSADPMRARWQLGFLELSIEF